MERKAQVNSRNGLNNNLEVICERLLKENEVQAQCDEFKLFISKRFYAWTNKKNQEK